MIGKYFAGCLLMVKGFLGKKVLSDKLGGERQIINNDKYIIVWNCGSV